MADGERRLDDALPDRDLKAVRFVDVEQKVVAIEIDKPFQRVLAHRKPDPTGLGDEFRFVANVVRNRSILGAAERIDRLQMQRCLLPHA